MDKENTHTHTHTQSQPLLKKKKKEILTFVSSWMEPEGVLLSKINQRKTSNVESENTKLRLVVARGRG